MFQIGWRLVFFCRHQLAGLVEHVVLMADVDLEIVLSADGLNPYRFALAMYGL
jgi:hypothetical protein